MATVLQHKRSNVAGQIPATSSLALGELALNTADGFVYLKVDDGTNPEKIVRLRGEPLSDTAISVDTFVGDGSTTSFPLSRIPEADHFVFVTINGVQQQVDAYSLSGAVLTLSAAPGVGDEIEARVFSVVTSAVQVRDYYSYVYTIGSSTTTISGVDDYGAVLDYDIEKVEVYYNGIRLVKGPDFSAGDGVSITLNAPVSSGHVEVVSLSKASIVDTTAIRPFSTVASTTAQQLVDKFQKEDFRTAKYLVQMTNGSNYHVTEVLIMHNDTDVWITEYGTMYTNTSLGTISADIFNGYVRLLVTPANVSNTTVKGQRITVTV